MNDFNIRIEHDGTTDEFGTGDLFAGAAMRPRQEGNNTLHLILGAGTLDDMMHLMVALKVVVNHLTKIIASAADVPSILVTMASDIEALEKGNIMGDQLGTVAGIDLTKVSAFKDFVAKQKGAGNPNGPAAPSAEQTAGDEQQPPDDSAPLPF